MQPSLRRIKQLPSQTGWFSNADYLRKHGGGAMGDGGWGEGVEEEVLCVPRMNSDFGHHRVQKKQSH